MVDAGEGTLQFTVQKMVGPLIKNVTNLQPVPKLYLQLGKVKTSFRYISHQFVGKITNVNIFDLTKKKNQNFAENKIKNPCIEGDFLSWKDMQWNVSGNNVDVEQVKDDLVCVYSYRMQLPLLWDFVEALNICNNLGKGKISGLPNPSNVSGIKEYFGEKFDTCNAVWTPYSGSNQLNSNVYFALICS